MISRIKLPTNTKQELHEYIELMCEAGHAISERAHIITGREEARRLRQALSVSYALALEARTMLRQHT